jgi:hypothetical protein
MGIYRRSDSRFWWMFLEGTRQKERTNIPVGCKGGKREARRRYQARMLDLAQGETDDLLRRAIELLHARQPAPISRSAARPATARRSAAADTRSGSAQ